MCRRVAVLRTYVPEEVIASIIVLETINDLGKCQH
jgi:hypothetical protein